MENNLKRFLSLLLALVMVIGLMPVGHVHAEEQTYLKITELAAEVEANASYVICLHGTKNALTNQQGSGAWSSHTLATAACGEFAESRNLWTLEAADGGYKIKNAGGYLLISRNTANLNETGHIFELVYHGDAGWAIKSLETNEYGNNLGDSGSIGGWSDDGTKFDLYKVVEMSAEEADPFGKLRGLWKKVSVDTETVYNETEGLFEYAWDNDTITRWHSNWQGASDKLNGSNTFTGVIDFGQAYVINQFSFLPRQDNNNSGLVTQASLYVRENEQSDWIPAAEHATFASNTSWKNICFEAQSVRYVKFVAEQSNDGWVAVAEFNIAHDDHHFTGAVTREATCTAPGEMTYSCSCGYSYVKETPVAEHSWIDATCTAPKTCSVCGATEGEAGGGSHVPGALVEAVPEVHNADELRAAVAAHYICTVCGAYLTEDLRQTTLEELTGEMPAHSFSEATCTVPATCACGATEGEALGHQLVVTGCKKPTLCEPGATGTTTCGVCGEVFSESTAINQLPVASVLHDNKIVALNGCEYTYNASNSSFTHTDANGTVYSVKPSAGVGVQQPALIPQTTAEVFSVSLIWGSGDFDGRVQISGNGTSISTRMIASPAGISAATAAARIPTGRTMVCTCSSPAATAPNSPATPRSPLPMAWSTAAST